MDELALRDPASGKGASKPVGPAANIASLLAEMDRLQAETGLVPELVMYEQGSPRTPFTRRTVTRELLLESPSRADVERVAKTAGLSFKSAPDFAPGKYVYLAQSGAEALAAMAALESEVSVTTNLILARQQAKRTLPNDTLIGKQWHLKSSGQTGALAGTDSNIESVWAYPTAGAGRRGRGINIGVVDDGLETGHPDLAANVDTVNDKDWNDSTPTDPNPGSGDDHGTACAGNAAAVGNNGLGVSGTAPEAKLVGMRLIAAATTDTQEAEAMGYLPQLIQIKTNSWGPNDTGNVLEGPGPLTLAALKNAAETGRGGKGSIILWAAGNGGDVGDNSNYDGYANSIYTIAIAAFDSQSRQAYYSEPGANVVVTAPSNGDTPALGITTVDRSSSNGYNDGSTTGELSDSNYTQTFGGTSSATPTAAGIVACILEANPNLGWRDLQELLIKSAKKVNPTDSDWVTNAAGFHFNHKFGAGLIDAAAAVALAPTWVNLSPQLQRTSSQNALSVAIPNQNTTGITRQFVISPADNLRVEQVTVTVNINHTSRGNLKVTLTSPSGTLSTLAEVHADSGDNYPNWKFMSLRHWGENAAGTWVLKVSDESAASNTTGGTLTAATLDIFGSQAAASNPPPTVTLNSPAEGTVFSPGTSINLLASASDQTADGSTGSVTSVDFLVNGAILNTDLSAPYSFTWTPQAGSYSVSARATDSDGASTTTTPITLEVRNARPSVTAALLTPSSTSFTDELIKITGLTSIDPDSDPVSLSYQWQYSVDGSTFTDSATDTTASLSPNDSRSGKLWRCRITPSDSGGPGSAFLTAAIALNRRPPSTALSGQPFSYDSDLFLRSTETHFNRAAILSEFSQGPSGGNAEWVEFLVLQSGSLRAWKLTDASGAAITLADSATWDAIPAGTLVLLYNGASKDPLLPADDSSPGSDFRMVVASTNSSMITGTWPAYSNGGDAIVLKNAAGSVLSQISYGTGTLPPNIGSVGSTKSANYRGNSEEGSLSATGWSVETSTLARSEKLATKSQATLPITFGGPWNTLPSGFTATGLSTYSTDLGGDTGGSSAKFDSSADSLVIELDGPPSLLSYQLKGNPTAGSATSGTFVVQQSADNTTWTTLRTLTDKDNVDTAYSDPLESTTRFLRFLYQTKTAGNIALDRLSVSKATSSSALTLTITPSTFAENSGATAATATLTLTNPATSATVLTLSSADSNSLSIPASITIPSGNSSVTFPIAAIDNSLTDGNRTVALTASSGTLSASASATITDDEAPLNGVTPGAPNGGDHSIWVAQLRSGGLNQPAQFKLASTSQTPAGLTLDPTTGLLSGTLSAEPGNYTLVIERTNSLGESTSQNFTLTVTGGVTTVSFASWINTYPTLTDRTASGDPDNDGITNLMEYFMGLNPSLADASATQKSLVTSTGFSLTYRRAKTITGLSWAVEFSNTLPATLWSTTGVTETIVDKGTYHEVTATAPRSSTDPRKFLRLRVSIP